jgi:putative flippase GtrA
MAWAKSRWLRELVRYTLISSASFALDLGILSALVEWAGVSAVAASIVGYLVALFVDYVLSIVWVFSDRRMREKQLAEFTTFALVGLAGLGVNTIVMAVATGLLSLHYAIAKTLAGLCVLGFTFVVRRQLLFVRPARGAEVSTLPAK